MTARISNLQHGSTGDGPGLRTTVFFAGCPLRCAWCHNPETWERRPRLLYYAARCAGCRVCASVCPNGAHSFADGVHRFDRARCDGCGACAALCPVGALADSSREASLGEILCEIDADADFYAASGGGVTLSGGEPLGQADFCAALGEACRARGYRVLLDTAGAAPRGALERVLPWVDEVYFDWKTADADDCQRYTGGNYVELYNNLQYALRTHPAVTVRVPVIPGVNADKLPALAEALVRAGARRVDLLPFHRLGSGKWTALGLCYGFAETPPLPRAELARAADVMRGFGFDVRTE